MPALSKATNDALNEQLHLEFYSAYLYLSMAAFCESANLPGAAQWLEIQWGEELGHATKLLHHLTGRDGNVVLKAIEEPPHEFGSLSDVFKHVLEHEQAVTASIYKHYEVCVAEKDYAAQTLLQWYIDEQVEEERTAAEIVAKLELAGGDGSALLMIDQQLSQRAAAQPA
jgi:ferritin